jgi:hypothetical protein
LTNSLKILGYLGFLLVFVSLTTEVLLRNYPRLMPYANSWNYIHHYMGISELIGNSEGLRHERFQILAVGDSFTRSAEVPPGKDWPTVIRDTFDEPIFNLGIGGSSTIEQFVILQNVPLPDTLNTVVLAIFQNDILANIEDLERLKKEGAEPFLDRASFISNVQIFIPCDKDGWYVIFRCWYFHSYAFSTVMDIFRQWVHGDEFQQQIHDLSSMVFDQVSQRYLHRDSDLSEFASDEAFRKKYGAGIETTVGAAGVLKDYLAAKGIRLLVVYIPSSDEVYIKDWAKLLGRSTGSDASIGKLMSPYMTDLKIPYLDLTNRLRGIRATEAPLYLKFDAHFSVSGNQATARWIADFLREYKSLDTEPGTERSK